MRALATPYLPQHRHTTDKATQLEGFILVAAGPVLDLHGKVLAVHGEVLAVHGLVLGRPQQWSHSPPDRRLAAARSGAFAAAAAAAAAATAVGLRRVAFFLFPWVGLFSFYVSALPPVNCSDERSTRRQCRQGECGPTSTQRTQGAPAQQAHCYTSPGKQSPVTYQNDTSYCRRPMRTGGWREAAES